MTMSNNQKYQVQEVNMASLTLKRSEQLTEQIIKSFVFFDLETTDLIKRNKYPKITEMALVAVSRSHLLVPQKKLPRVLAKLVIPISPNIEIPHIVTKITKLTNTLLENTNPFDTDVYCQVIHFLRRLEQPICFVAHNGKLFDFPIILKEFRDINQEMPSEILSIDSIDVFRNYFSEQRLIKRQRLEEDQPKNEILESEDTFRPFYYKLYDWAARNPQHKQRNITFYRLSATIADCLKSLFVLFASHFLKHAALLLTTNNFSITDEVQETTLTDESSRIELVEVIMLTLHRVFSYNLHNFVTQDRFNILLQPIVDQIENIMGSKEEYEKRANDLIVPCIASFTGAIPDDSLHRQLVCQIVLKSRHTKACVRNTVVNCYMEIARKLGEDFRPLLSDILPSLSELLEDEDEVVEKNAQNAVRILKEILEEPLQKYF